SVKRATGNVRTKIIINFTDPEKFPDIEPIYTRMAEMGPDIIKIVVKASQQEDSRRMVEYIQKYDNTRSPKFVGICTHTEGLLTRSHGPFYGNYTTYACLEGKSANSGQLTIPSLLAVAAQNFTSCLGRKR
ncbi:MAG TPA: type I 3-dehydroquinate dehydratase, partial [Candidatus Nanoarchaeia archaeon]|nr:type I 3-dehydroquinate dehydratase [Candidatus Nanoarchaeia archaeon]